MIGSKRKKMLVPLGLTVAATFIAGTAIAGIGDGGLISACYKKDGGSLRVIDPATGSCSSKEGALSWNIQGPRGDTGDPGPEGSLGTLDDLEGIPCETERLHPGVVHVAYGTGTEAAVMITCVIPVVANPGPFSVEVTGGMLSAGFLQFPVPTSGWSFSGQIDRAGTISVPGSGFRFSDVPFDTTQDVAGVGSVHAWGTLSLASTDATGTLDPANGAASLSDGLYTIVALTATAQSFGQTAQIYSGTCAFGSATAPISLTLTTDPPGVPYSQDTGAVTLSSAFRAPSLSGCDPAVPGLYAFLLDLFAGSGGSLTLSGTTDPILRPA